MRKSRKKSSANQANRPKTAEDGAKAFANLDLTTVSSRNSATCYSYVDEIENRNRAFTSISRSKGWVRISGSGDRMPAVLKELNALLMDAPQLKFKFPDMRDLKIRRLDASETSRRKKEVKRATQMVDSLLRMDPSAIGDLDPEMLVKLRSLLSAQRESE